MTKPTPPEDLFPPSTTGTTGTTDPVAPAPILQGNSVSQAGAIDFPYGDTPAPSTPPAVNIDQPTAPGFGPEVPDTTQGITAADSPGALFTAENMGGAMDSLDQFADKAPGVTADQTVQGQLEGILSKDNELFDWARGQASQYANSRGLLNSDIAAEASAQAVMGVAMPIAQQDANTFAQRASQEAQFWQTAGLQAFDATIQSTLMAQDHLQQLVSISAQGDVNSRLQLEQFGYNWQLSVQDNLQQMQQLALQGDINSQLALQQFGFDVSLMEQDFGYRVKLADIDLRNALSLSEQDHTQWLDRMAQDHVNNLANISAAGVEDRRNISAQGDVDLTNIAATTDANIARDQEQFGLNLQQKYLDQVGIRNSQFSAEIASIYQREGLTVAQQNGAVAVARTNYENDLAFIAAQYSSNPYWDPSWIVSGIPTPGQQPLPPPVPPTPPGPSPDPGPAPGPTPGLPNDERDGDTSSVPPPPPTPTPGLPNDERIPDDTVGPAPVPPPGPAPVPPPGPAPVPPPGPQPTPPTPGPAPFIPPATIPGRFPNRERQFR